MKVNDKVILSLPRLIAHFTSLSVYDTKSLYDRFYKDIRYFTVVGIEKDYVIVQSVLKEGYVLPGTGLLRFPSCCVIPFKEEKSFINLRCYV